MEGYDNKIKNMETYFKLKQEVNSIKTKYQDTDLPSFIKNKIEEITNEQITSTMIYTIDSSLKSLNKNIKQHENIKKEINYIKNKNTNYVKEIDELIKKIENDTNSIEEKTKQLELLKKFIDREESKQEIFKKIYDTVTKENNPHGIFFSTPSKKIFEGKSFDFNHLILFLIEIMFYKNISKLKEAYDNKSHSLSEEKKYFDEQNSNIKNLISLGTFFNDSFKNQQLKKMIH